LRFPALALLHPPPPAYPGEAVVLEAQRVQPDEANEPQRDAPGHFVLGRVQVPQLPQGRPGDGAPVTEATTQGRQTDKGRNADALNALLL
jgi:hypothetical protein